MGKSGEGHDFLQTQLAKKYLLNIEGALGEAQLFPTTISQMRKEPHRQRRHVPEQHLEPDFLMSSLVLFPSTVPNPDISA